MDSRLLSFGTIGSAASFASQAAKPVRAAFGRLDKPRPFPDAQAMFAAVRDGEIDAAIGALASRSGGDTPLVDAVLGSDPPLFVIHEQEVAFHACLLAHQDAKLEDVKTVYGGHASLPLARDFVRESLPWATCAVQHNGRETAARILAGDRSIAMLGTQLMAQQGFATLAEDIDGERSGLWWVVANRPLTVARPQLLILSARLADDGALGRFAADFAAAGWALSSCASRPTGAALLETDMLLRLRGSGLLGEATRLAGRHGARLLGALSETVGEAA